MAVIHPFVDIVPDCLDSVAAGAKDGRRAKSDQCACAPPWRYVPMVSSLVVGLGRAGAGLHLPVLSRLRATASYDSPFDGGPIVVCDPARSARRSDDSVVHTSSLERGGDLLDPQRTVAHLCVPPSGRTGVIERVARLGISRVILEKPLATDETELRRIGELCTRYGLDLVVVAHWLQARLTRRIADIVGEGAYGDLRTITVSQDKPRFSASSRSSGHDTAFDVEIPHSLGVVLRLAGQAELVAASCSDLPGEDTEVSWLGGARLVLRHFGGVRTDIRSDLAAPVRERSIVLEFESGTVTGHYPPSADDEHAQLVTVRGGVARRDVFPDDALGTFLLAAYRYFAGDGPRPGTDLAGHSEAVRLLCAAKRHCGVGNVEYSSGHVSRGGVT